MTGDGSVQDWISDSVWFYIMIVQLQKLFSEKIIASYCPIKDDNFVQSLPIQISSIITDQTQLLNSIDFKEIFLKQT